MEIKPTPDYEQVNEMLLKWVKESSKSVLQFYANDKREQAMIANHIRNLGYRVTTGPAPFMLTISK